MTADTPARPTTAALRAELCRRHPGATVVRAAAYSTGGRWRKGWVARYPCATRWLGRTLREALGFDR